MSLFSDDLPPTDASTDAPAARRDPATLRRRRGWIALAVAFALTGVLALWPSTYVVQQPGPVFNTLGTVESEGEKIPLITVNDAETFDTAGALDMLTVQVVGNPEQRANWFEVARAWFDSSRTVVPVDAVFPPNVTTDEREAQNAELMVDSQQDAIAAALEELDYDINAQLEVGAIAEGAPAQGRLDVGDEILTVNGTAVTTVDEVREVVQQNGTGRPADFVVRRDGSETTVPVTPEELQLADGTSIAAVGISTRISYTFPIDVEIKLDSVGGPSAGMMFALGIIDKLTPGELNGGKQVAGTGTITAGGAVGSIGGIRQKLFGARDAGADYFLAPADNCNEVVGHVPEGIRVFSVATLDDSLAVLDAIRTDGNLDTLPTCTTTVAAE